MYKKKCIFIAIFRFLQKFRVSKEAFEYILGKIGANDGIRRTYTPPVIRLALTLELLGSRSHGRLAGSDLCSTVAQATFSVVVSEMIQELEDKLCTEWIQLDINANTKRWFYKEFGIPGGKLILVTLVMLYCTIIED